MRIKYEPIISSTKLEAGDIFREPNKNEDYDYFDVLKRLDNQKYEVHPFSIDRRKSLGVQFSYDLEKMIQRKCDKLN